MGIATHTPRERRRSDDYTWLSPPRWLQGNMGAPYPDAAHWEAVSSQKGQWRLSFAQAAHLYADIVRVFRYHDPSAQSKPRSPAERIHILVDENGMEPTAATNGQVYVTLPADNAARVVTPLSHRKVRDFLESEYVQMCDTAPGRPALDAGIAKLRMQASSASDLEVFDRRYYDLEHNALWVDGVSGTDGKPRGTPYPIAPAGKRIAPDEDQPDLYRFTRQEHFASLPVDTKATFKGPVPLLKLFRPYLHAANDDDLARLLMVLLAAWHPADGPYPVLYLTGPTGVAKTWTEKRLASMVDPNFVQVNGVPKDAAAVFGHARKTRVVVYDQLQSLPSWFQDEVCKLATGYEGANRGTGYDFKRPVFLNGLEPSAVRPDFQARTLFITLPPFAGRRDDTALKAEFEVARPRLQAALFRVIGYGLARYPKIAESYVADEDARLASFEAWVTACEAGISDLAPGTFLRLLRESRRGASKVVAEGSPDVRALLKLLQDAPLHTWAGTGSQLAAALTDVAAREPVGGDTSTSAVTLMRGLKRRATELAAVHGLTWATRRESEQVHTLALPEG